MSSIFLRIYGGLLFVVVLVSVLSGITATMINGTHLAQYREDILRGTFRLGSYSLQDKTLQEQQQWIRQWRHDLNIPFRILPIKDSFLSHKNRQQLRKGNIVINMLNDNKAKVYVYIKNETLLTGTVSPISDQVVAGTLALLQKQIQSVPAPRRLQELDTIASYAFNYPAVTLPAKNTVLSTVQMNLLHKGGFVMLLDNTKKTLLFYTQLPDSDRLIRLGPIRLPSFYSFEMLLIIGLFVLFSVSLAIYILVRDMEKRLRKLERATSRFSLNDFDVRVSMSNTDSIGRLAKAFNSMASHIQNLLQIQKEMIRGVSHELRTPLARLRFGMEMVKDAESAQERHNQLSGMDNDIQELDNLVDEFLTYANLEQTPSISLEHYNADHIIHQVVCDHRRLQNRVAIEHLPCRLPDKQQHAPLDQRYMHRAIQNLVGNACRYANTYIQVQLSDTKNHMVITVDDDGPGIPKEQRERIFTAFSRLDDSRTRKSGGYGLGLSIVNRIMFWHKGRVEVHDSPLGGSRFQLIWPKHFDQNHLHKKRL
ncbi:Sensor protein RstB [invertebrate metagenome]|uniref:histidine kinase n=1 Tax=invertebrate metagenome TaxID=1711999 RepID=A0A2H9TAB9_9ZZZZ